jgi:N-acetylmuramoyl-L-alanine amidase
MAQKKVFLGVGHGGSDPGAVKYIKEADVNLTMALACRDVLVAHNVLVMMSRTRDENDDLNEEIRECNAFAPDLAVDIHNNAGRGDGFEAYYSVVGGLGKTLALNIEVEIKKIGQNSRGIKTKPGNGGADYFGFIREINCPSIIVEGVFVDNKADAAQADTAAEQKKFGEAYARGILKTLGIAYKGTTASSAPAAKPATSTSSSSAKAKEPDVIYNVKTQKHGWLGEVKNLTDYAGWQDSPIVAVAMKVTSGAIKYRVHVKGGGWLGWITKYNIKDAAAGYAGNGQPIDAIQIIYDGGKVAKYRVAPVGGSYYDWQKDNQTINGQDGYAGCFGRSIGKLQIDIV